MRPVDSDSCPPVHGIFCEIARLIDELAWLCGVKTVLPSGRVIGVMDR